MTAVNSSRRLQLYSIRIDWRPNQPQQATQKPTQVAPVLLVRPVLLSGSDRVCAPLTVNPAIEGNDQESQNMTLPQLSHLLFMPAAPEAVGQDVARTTVLAIFSYLPEQPVSLNVSQVQNNPFSVICRWELIRSKVTVHPIFQSLAKKKKKSIANVRYAYSIASLWTD